jgi:O-antigen/teichoic acid export membrane protein
MFAKTVGFVLSTALPLILVRRLDQTQFGLYKQAFLVVASSVGLLPLGFGMSAYYFLPREPERRSPAILNIVLFNAVIGCLAGLIFFAYPALIERIVGGAGLLGYAPWIGVTVLLWIFGAFLEIVPIANGEMKLAMIFIICVQLTRTLLLAGAALFFGTLASLIAAAILQGIVQSCILLAYLHSRFKGFWRGFDPELLRRQFSYALPLGFGGLLYVIQTDLHNYIISNRFGPAIFAVYAIGVVQIPLMGLLQDATTAVLIPKIGLLQQENKSREIIEITARVMRKLAVAYFPIYAFMMVAGREFISFLFTDRYRDSWPIFAVNLTLLPCSILLQDPLFRAFASERFFLLRFRVFVVVVLVIALLAATSRFGPMGAIAAVVGVTIVERAITATRFARILHVSRSDLPLLTDIGKLALASLIAALSAALVRSFLPGVRPFAVLLICGIVFTPIYGAAVLWLKIPTGDEKNFIRGKMVPLLGRFGLRLSARTSGS